MDDRTIDSEGNTIGFYLNKSRNHKVAKLNNFVCISLTCIVQSNQAVDPFGRRAEFDRIDQSTPDAATWMSNHRDGPPMR